MQTNRIKEACQDLQLAQAHNMRAKFWPLDWVTTNEKIREN